jgi:serine phosphatase RsbU (regulator of sigma subunit)/anti-sigma regulatory factor (Ser/Thr protein kinase)
MRQTFLKWLFIFIAGAFALTFGISFFVQTRQARENAIQLIRLRIQDARRQLVGTENNLQRISEMTDAMALIKARAFAGFIEQTPVILDSADKLQQIRLLLDVDELHVSDEKGILIASIPATYCGYDMAAAEQSAAFLPALSDPSFALAQEPQRKGINNEMFQYAGVARLDRPGIIQIGYHPRRLMAAAQLADIRNVAASFRIGTHGAIIICRNNRIISNGGAEFCQIDLLAARINQENLLRQKIFKATIGAQQFLAVAETFQDYWIIGILPKNEMYLRRNSVVGALIVVDLLLFTLVFVLVAILVQKIVIDGIYRVNSSLEKITRGNLEVQVQVTNTDEFKALSDGINATVAALKNAIRETAARIDAELKFAHAIQVSGLPEGNPVFSEQTPFSLAASMKTAREVGGDFYDYLLVDDDHLWFIVADVSGKGIPAALFMMTSKTLLRNLAANKLPANEILRQGNLEICARNEAGLFVTAWIGILELSSGHLECANAGHNPPLLLRADGSSEFLKIQPGLVLGGLESSKYHSHSLFLKAGDRLVLYTDGVTEAENPAGEFFAEVGLQRTLARESPGTYALQNLLSALNQEVSGFADGAQQTDDITLLALEFQGQAAHRLVLPAKTENLQLLREFLEKTLLSAAVAEKLRFQLHLVAEEVFVNIAKYAYPDGAGEISLSLRLEPTPRRIILEFRDRGIPWNPLEKEPPDINLPAEQRPIGGMGILIVKKIIDECQYKFEQKQNILTLSKNISEE